jgi:hypothetical protein
MESLPTEILSRIFSYLDVEDFLKVSEVCRRFEEIINTRRFLKKFFVNISKIEQFEKTLRNYVNVKLVNLTDKEVKKCRESRTILRRISSSVQKVLLDNLEIRQTKFLSELVMNFESVTEIRMEGIYVMSAHQLSIKPIKFQNLRVLKFFYNSNQLLKLFSSVQNQLKIFKLCLVPHVDEETKLRNFELVMSILRNNRDCIEKLNLYDVNFDDVFLEKLSQIKLDKLTKFSMSFNSHLPANSRGFHKFITKHVTHLMKFKVRTFDHVDQQHLKVIIDHAENIRSLNLIICSFCNYESFAGFRNLTKLETLKIQPTNYCNIGNICYQSFVEDKILGYRNEVMRNVTIKYLANISEEVLNRICASFPNLVRLNLSSELEVDSSHVEVLKRKLQDLKHLVLNNREIITE